MFPVHTKGIHVEKVSLGRFSGLFPPLGQAHTCHLLQISRRGWKVSSHWLSHSQYPALPPKGDEPYGCVSSLDSLRWLFCQPDSNSKGKSLCSSALWEVVGTCSTLSTLNSRILTLLISETRRLISGQKQGAYSSYCMIQSRFSFESTRNRLIM